MISSADFTRPLPGLGAVGTAQPTRGGDPHPGTGRERSRSCRADPLAVSVQFRWPSALRNLAVCVQDLVAADNGARCPVRQLCDQSRVPGVGRLGRSRTSPVCGPVCRPHPRRVGDLGLRSTTSSPSPATGTARSSSGRSTRAASVPNRHTASSSEQVCSRSPWWTGARCLSGVGRAPSS